MIHFPFLVPWREIMPFSLRLLIILSTERLGITVLSAICWILTFSLFLITSKILLLRFALLPPESPPTLAEIFCLTLLSSILFFKMSVAYYTLFYSDFLTKYRIFWANNSKIFTFLTKKRQRDCSRCQVLKWTYKRRGMQKHIECVSAYRKSREGFISMRVLR